MKQDKTDYLLIRENTLRESKIKNKFFFLSLPSIKNTSMKNLWFASMLFAFLGLIGCQEKTNSTSGQHNTVISDTSSVRISPSYAKGFKVSYPCNGVRLVDIQDPQGKQGGTYHYALVNKGAVTDNIPSEYTVIEVPIK